MHLVEDEREGTCGQEGCNVPALFQDNDGRFGRVDTYYCGIHASKLPSDRGFRFFPDKETYPEAYK